jgi:hypothetical protein
MNNSLEELLELCGELECLQERAAELLKEFPKELAQAQAYGALEFGASSNPYDITFRSIVSSLEEKLGNDHCEERMESFLR